MTDEKASLMKFTITVAAVLLTQLACFAQGQIIFRNKAPGANPPLDAPILGRMYWWDGTDVVWGGTTPLPGTGYRAALMGGPVGSTPTSASYAGNLQMLANPNTGTTWVDVGTGSQAGYVSSVNYPRIVPNVNYGEYGVFQVVVWKGNYTSWADAYANGGIANTAWSAPLTLRVSLSLTDINVPYLTGLQSFEIPLFVPEPASGLLLGFGVAAMLFRHRRGRD